MSQKSVIVALVVDTVKDGYHPNKEVWASLKDFCNEYSLVYNTMVRKEFPFECVTQDKCGNRIEWMIDKCEIFRKGEGKENLI